MLDLSVVMITYFAENYIAEAIESVLMQETEYSYEIVISDDCSKDSTQEILKKYEAKYPNKIRLFFNEENVGLSMNNYLARCQCKGRYIAVLDGDDYWIDPQKIQWQVKFLDSHPDHYAVACSVQGRYGNSEKAFAIYPEKRYRNKTITMDTYLKGGIFGTNGMMMRNAFLTEEGRAFFSMVPKASTYIDDATECILILLKGNVFVSSKESTVYRIPQKTDGKHNFNSINTTRQKIVKEIKLYNYLYANLSPRIDLLYLYQMNLSVAFADSIRRGKIMGIKDYISMLPDEYIKRGIVYRSFIGMFCFVVKAIRRKAYALVRGGV